MAGVGGAGDQGHVSHAG